MNAQDFIPILGESILDTNVLEIFEKNGVDLNREIVRLDEEFRCYIERPLKGISFIFTDEAYFKKQLKAKIGRGLLFFTGFFLYSQGYEDYNEYIGKFPFKLSFKLNGKKIREILGEPNWKRIGKDDRIISERWDNLNNFCLHITYKDSLPTIFSINVPDQK